MSMVRQPHILIVGFGSVGRRHAQNLARYGANISVVDTRADRLSPPPGVTLAGAYTNADAAFAGACFDGAVIATPTAFHEAQTGQALAQGCRVLLEKPVAMDLASGRRIAAAEARAGLPILLGYTWRWWEALREMRRRLHAGVIGKPLRGEFVMASHLEDWHPGEPLTDFFMSSAELGGGALLDESHWLDQMVWMFGMPAEISADIEHVSALPINCDDQVELLAFYEHGLRVRVHLDLYTRPTERSIAVIGDGGALKWSFDSNVLAEFGSGQWRKTPFAGERNAMFEALAIEFLDVLVGKPPLCTLADGLAVLEVLELARQSSIEQGQRLQLSGHGPS